MYRAFILIATLLVASAAARAQQQSPSPPAQAPQADSAQSQLPEKPQAQPLPSPGSPHRFFDSTNKWLFAGVLASRSVDFASTRNMRARGRDEILLTNDVVDNIPAFVAIELGATAASVGVSYWLHRKGHHSLERWVSIVHIGVTTFGAGRNYLLETRHPAPSPVPAPAIRFSITFPR